MKIWLDGQALQSDSRYRGIGRFAYEFVRAIKDFRPSTEILMSFNLALPDRFLEVRTLLGDFVDPENIFTFHGCVQGGEYFKGYSEERKLSEIALAHHVACLAPDIAISLAPFEGCADPMVPFLSTFGHDIKTVGVFYDAIPLRFSDHYLGPEFPHGVDTYMRRLGAYSQFDATLSISEFSNREVQSLTDVTNSTAVHLGLSESFKDLLKVEPSGLVRLPNEPFLLSVGGLDWRKDIKTLVSAIEQLRKPNDQIHYVVAGRYGLQEAAKIRSLWSRAGLSETRLHFTGHVTDVDLIDLFGKCACFIQSSVMEGFGLTVLEAMVCGAPVIAANAGATPEVLPNPSLLYEPGNAADLARVLTGVLNNKDFKAETAQFYKKQLKQFTWIRTAERAMKVIDSIATDLDRQPVSQKEIDAITLEALRDINAPKPLIAKTMAFASLPEPKLGQTYWDVSSTARAKHITGIQRVVTNIAGNANMETSHSLMAGYEEPGFYEVDYKDSTMTVEPSKRIQFGKRDRIIMLDSSWDIAKFHRGELRRAKVMGANIYSVLYDLVPVRTPGFCHEGIPPIFAEWLEEAIHYSDGVLCISRTVADELAVFLKGIGFNGALKIGYWHLGSDLGVLPGDHVSRLPETRSKTPHFLVVGTMEPRKGHRVIVDAFKKARAAGFEGELTIVGRQGWNMEGLIHQLGVLERIDDGIRWSSDVEDDDLNQLYGEVDAVITASYVEGFGLPIVEAAARGCRVIASDILVYREVGDMADVTYFRSGDPSDLARVMLEFDAKSNTTLSSAKPPLTWQESTDAIINVLNSDNWYIELEGGFDQKNVRRNSLIMEYEVDFEAVDFTLTQLSSPSLGANGTHYVLIHLKVNSEVCWTSLGAEFNRVGGVGLIVRVESDDGERNFLDTLDKSRIWFPYAVVSGLEYIFHVQLDSVSWSNGSSFHVHLFQEGERYASRGLVIQRDV